MKHQHEWAGQPMSPKPEAPRATVNIVAGLELAAETFAGWAADAEKDGAKKPKEATYHLGRSHAFSQAATHFRMLADVAKS